MTRAAVQIPSGEVGFAYVLGRDQRKARLCAVCDALWQSKRYRDVVERRVLAQIRARLEAERACQRARTAATRVDFLTLVRGEDLGWCRQPLSQSRCSQAKPCSGP